MNLWLNGKRISKADLTSIIDNLFESCCFDYLTAANYEDLVIYPLKTKTKGSNFKWIYDEGVTKMVIIPEDSNFVIKIPFWGDYDDIPFEHAGVHLPCWADEKWNYCETEYILYQMAITEGVNEFFAEVDKIYLKDKIFYIQSKVQPLNDTDSYNDYIEHDELIQTYREKNISIWEGKSYDGDNFDQISPLWLNDLYNYCLKKNKSYIFDELITFMEEYDIFEDLHSGNVGYTYNGAPIILDYSGWNDQVYGY